MKEPIIGRFYDAQWASDDVFYALLQEVACQDASNAFDGWTLDERGCVRVEGRYTENEWLVTDVKTGELLPIAIGCFTNEVDDFRLLARYASGTIKDDWDLRRLSYLSSARCHLLADTENASYVKLESGYRLCRVYLKRVLTIEKIVAVDKEFLTLIRRRGKRK